MQKIRPLKGDRVKTWLVKDDNGIYAWKKSEKKK